MCIRDSSFASQIAYYTDVIQSEEDWEFAGLYADEAVSGKMCIRDRYYALNLHSVFYRGTLEWRCFESTLHAGRVRANITLALAISCLLYTSRCV